MQGIRKKKQQMAKDLRSKQRSEKLSLNRSSCFGLYENKSLVALIFYMIEKQTNQDENIDENSFQQFLDLVTAEIYDYDQESDTQTNEKIKFEIFQRYEKRLISFEHLIHKTDPLNRIELLENDQNNQMFNLIRFLFRIQAVQENHLQIFDCLLQSADARTTQLCKSNCSELRNSQFFQQLTRLIRMKISLLKQVFNLNYILEKIHAKEINNLVPPKLGCQNQMIKNLIQRWIVCRPLFNFLLDLKVANQIKNKKIQQEIGLKLLMQGFFTLYIQFLYRSEQAINKFFDYFFLENSPQKILELMFSMLFILDNSFFQKQRDINDLAATEYKKQEAFTFINMSTRIIKKLQLTKQKYDSLLLPLILKTFINFFVEKPSIVIKNFFDQPQITKNNNILSLKEISEYFVPQKLCQKEPLVLILIHFIEDMELETLQTFVELLSILASYNDTTIDHLIRMKEFDGLCGKVYDFRTIIENLSIDHISVQIRRRGLWLLSNIAGSEEFYHFSLYFIEKFFHQKILDQDYTSKKTFKQELLVIEHMIQVIMNYLSNLKNYQEIENLIQIKRKSNPLSSQQQNPQSMMNWIVKILASVVRNIAQNHGSIKNQKFTQVIVYSLYHLLFLQQNRNKSQNNQNILFKMMEQLQIPKQLQSIYHKLQFPGKQSQLLKMLEYFLDQVQKAKQNQ